MAPGGKAGIREIRPAEQADELDRLLKAAYREEARWLGVTTFPPLERTPHDLLTSANRFFAVVSNGTLCGVVELEYSAGNGEPKTTIASLAVAPQFARQGIGRALVSFVLDTRLGQIDVTTGMRNEPALRLYESLGFEQIERFTTPEGIAMVAYRTYRPPKVRADDL